MKSLKNLVKGTTKGPKVTLGRLLDDHNASLGDMVLAGQDVAAAIAAERNPDVLGEARERARMAGDQCWAVALARRFAEIDPSPHRQLDYALECLWSANVEEADRIVATLPEGDIDKGRLLHARFMIDVALQRFDAARAHLQAAETQMPGSLAEMTREFCRRLIDAGDYEAAKDAVEKARAAFPEDFGFAQMDVRLVTIFDGVAAALARLQTYSTLVPMTGIAYRSVLGDLMMQRGRYNEVLDLVIAWIAETPKHIGYYHLGLSAAGQCDRVEEFIALVDRMRRAYPGLKALVELRCNAAIDQNDTDLADRLLAELGRTNTWGYHAARFAALLQAPREQDPEAAYAALRASGYRYGGPTILLALYYYYYSASTPNLQRALALIEPVIATSRGDSGLLAIYLRLLMALGRADEARSFYQALPQGLAKTAPLGPFAMAFLAADGADDAASAGWVAHLAETAPMALNARSSYAETIKLRYQGGPSDVLLFLTVFNGIEFLDWFLATYRKLGVDHFFIIDNGSTDGTFERLLTEEDVSVFRNLGSFAQSACGVFWANHLMRRFGVGHWCFHVDMDEAFVFPGMEKGRSLRDFLAYLDENNFASVPSLMLDIYPETLLAEPGSDPFASSRYIDRDYVSFPCELPPYRLIQGGIRARSSGRALLMTKAPLVKMTPDLAYLANNHQHTHLALSDVTSALLHYKFIGDFVGRVDEAINRGEHFMGARFYRAMKGSMTTDTAREGGLLSEFSAEYTGPDQLVSLGLMQSSHRWEKFLR